MTMTWALDRLKLFQRAAAKAHPAAAGSWTLWVTSYHGVYQQLDIIRSGNEPLRQLAAEVKRTSRGQR